jgi:hypothetical protein
MKDGNKYEVWSRYYATRMSNKIGNILMFILVIAVLVSGYIFRNDIFNGGYTFKKFLKFTFLPMFGTGMIFTLITHSIFDEDPLKSMQLKWLNNQKKLMIDAGDNIQTSPRHDNYLEVCEAIELVKKTTAISNPVPVYPV